MSLSKRERYMLTGGAVVVALTVLIAWGTLPLARKWGELGRELEPKLAALALLEERTERHEALLARRSRLVRDVGLLVEPTEEPEETKQEEEPEHQAGDDAAEPEESEDQTGENAKPDGEEPPRPAEQAEPKPEAPALEALLEKAVKEAGGRVKLISARKSPGRSMALQHFEMVALQVETDLSAQSLTKLLHALEKGPRFVRVDELKLHHDFKKPDALGITLSVVAYDRAG